MGRVEEEKRKHRVDKKHEHLTPQDLERRALTLQALGWLLLAFDGIVAVFVFVGIRAGSWLWLYWTVIEGALGLVLVVAGYVLGLRATEALGRMAEPHLHATGEGEHRRAA